MLKKATLLLLSILGICIAVSGSMQQSSSVTVKDSPNTLRTTEYPTVHFFLNLLGIANILKGAAVQIYLIKDVIAIDQEINLKHLIVGASLILLSQILRLIECRHHATLKKNVTQKI